MNSDYLLILGFIAWDSESLMINSKIHLSYEQDMQKYALTNNSISDLIKHGPKILVF